MTKGKASSANQQGVALIVALIILLLVSVLGLSAMRSSIFSAKVATGVQADAMTFEVAESGLAIGYRLVESLDRDAFYLEIIESSGTLGCLTATGQLQNGSCTAGQSIDTRGLLQAEVLSSFAGNEPRSDVAQQVSYTGGGGTLLLVNHRVDILAESTMQSYSLESLHVQEVTKPGVAQAGITD